MSQSKAYIIRAISNMHAGSGDTNYGIIDNQVQRDAITNYPCINSSALKGALREFFEYELVKKDNPKTLKEEICNQQNGKTICEIFGNAKQESDDSKKALNAGAFHFDMGHLLAIPVRSDKVPFVLCTTKSILMQFASHLDLFKTAKEKVKSLRNFCNALGNEKAVVFVETIKNAYLEEQDIEAVKIENSHWETVRDILGTDEFAIVNNETFQNLTDNLPVIARNKLDNGESKNLWYEEVVPRESRFYTIIQSGSHSDTTAEKLATKFDDVIKGKLIQVGGNASIGYGKTTFTSI